MPVKRVNAIGSGGRKERVVVRRAKVRDLDVLVHQRRGMWTEMGGKTKGELDDADPVYRPWARSRLNSGTVVGWLAETEHRDIVAGAIVWLRPTVPRPGFKHQAQPFVLSMYTEPEWRGRGLASMLVAEAANWAREKGYKEILLHASQKGRRVYLHHGFSRTWEMRLQL